MLLSKSHLRSPAFCNVWCCAAVKIVPKRIRISAQLIYKYINFSLKCFLCAGKSSVVQTPLSLFSCSNKRTRSVMLFKGNYLLIPPELFCFSICIILIFFIEWIHRFEAAALFLLVLGYTRLQNSALIFLSAHTNVVGDASVIAQKFSRFWYSMAIFILYFINNHRQPTL